MASRQRRNEARTQHSTLLPLSTRSTNVPIGWQDCTNWCSLGPFPGWLWSDDQGRNWHNSGHFPQGAPAYGTTGPDGRPITSSDYHTSGGT